MDRVIFVQLKPFICSKLLSVGDSQSKYLYLQMGSPAAAAAGDLLWEGTVVVQQDNLEGLR